MASLPPEARFATHTVANQPPDLIDTDLLATDPALRAVALLLRHAPPAVAEA